MTRGATLGLFALAFSACLNEPKPSEGVSARLTGGTVAQVGSTNIAASEVSLVATARNLDLLEARRSAVRDALFAQGAVADVGIDSSEVETRVLARAMLEALSRDARLRPIDEAEFDDWRLARFIDVDRPEGFRVVHAVVLVDASAPEAKQKAARTHAEGLRLKLEPLVA